MPKIVDKDEMRNMLLDAAVRVFADKGYHAATISNVAAAAGIAKGTLYLYFESKDALTVAIAKRQFDALEHQIMLQENEETLDGFLEYLRRIMDVTDAEATSYKVFFEVLGPAFVSKRFEREAATFFDKLGRRYANQIKHLQKRGEIAAGYDADAIGRVFASMLDGVVLHRGLFGVPRKRHRRMVSQAVTLLGAGLRSRPLVQGFADKPDNKARPAGAS